MMVLAHTARAAPAPSWPTDFARFLVANDVLTNQNLQLAAAPALRLDSSACATGRLPGTASPVPVSAAIIAYEDDRACNRPTRLVLLQVSLDTDAAQAGRLQGGIAGGFPAPCFAGDLPQDPRRHAPVRHLDVWKRPGRIVALGTEAGDPGGVSLSLLQAAEHGEPASGAGAQARQLFLGGLPASCR